MTKTNAISVRETLRNKNILLTGATGFLGKVLLCMLLSKIPELGKVYVVLRSKAGRAPDHRLEKQINTSPAFQGLHETHGAALQEFLSQHVRVVEGDLTKENFGLSSAALSELASEIDLVLNCAGLVDFSPDLRPAFQTNVAGGLHALGVARAFGCPLLHISTAFVAGSKSGLVKEEAPDSQFEVASEIEELEELIASGSPVGGSWLKAARDRAHKCGYPNAYSYTKSLAESVILERRREVPVSIVRPSIIESALQFPFPGWNEGVTTCAPLSYFTSKWMRFIEINPSNVFDIIPVDTVCQGILVVAAALLAGSAKPIYHCTTSHLNPLNLRFALELIDLSHREHTRANGQNYLEKKYLSGFDSVLLKEDSIFTVSNVKKLAMILLDLADLGAPHVPDSVRGHFDNGRKALNQIKWDLIKAERAVETFSPYLTEYDYCFETINLNSHSIAEPEFRFNPQAISWSHYIVNIHEPGLRKWCYPLMEGKRVERYEPAFHCRLESHKDGFAGSEDNMACAQSRTHGDQQEVSL